MRGGLVLCALVAVAMGVAPALNQMKTPILQTKKAGGGYLADSPGYKTRQEYLKKPVPVQFNLSSVNDKSTELAGSIKCIVYLLIAFFFVYSGAYFVKQFVSLTSGRPSSPLVEILERACKTVDLAPMICVLFLATRLRAIYLATVPVSEVTLLQMKTKANPALYDLPTDWTQECMHWASTLLLINVGIVVLMPFVSGEYTFSGDGLGPVDSSRKTIYAILSGIKSVICLTMYAFILCVVVELINMKAPPALWGDKTPPISPAVMCTMILAITYFVVYIAWDTLNIVSRWVSTGDSSPVKKFEDILSVALQTMNMAPMVALLFIAVRMRALAIGLDGPQKWAQTTFYATTAGMITSAALTILGPILFGAQTKKGLVDGDITFEISNKTVGYVFTALRYAAILSVYVGLIIVVVSTFVIEAPGGKPLPPLSTALNVTLILTDVYFMVFLGIWVMASVKQFSGNDDALTGSSTPSWVNTAIVMFDSAKASTQFIPMMTILFLGARMRAMQVVGSDKAPQNWAQICMWMSTCAITLSAIMGFLMPLIGGGAPEQGIDGTSATPYRGSSTCSWVLGILRTLCILAVHAGAVAVIVSMFTITPENAGDLGLKDPSSWATDTVKLPDF